MVRGTVNGVDDYCFAIFGMCNGSCHSYVNSVDYWFSIFGMCNDSCHGVDYCFAKFGMCNGSCHGKLTA